VSAAVSIVDPCPSVDERRDEGVALREAVPLESHAALNLPADRRPSLDILREQDATRLPQLVPVRYGRMIADVFAFYRGGAAVMAADLAYSPRTTATVQLCGDAHMANFGLFYSPERRLIFDANDFDETLPGPFEWDVKRLAASCVLAMEQVGGTKKERRNTVRAAVGSYCRAINAAAAMTPLDLWYFRLDYDVLATTQLFKGGRKLVDRAAERAGQRTSLGALNKLTEVVDGQRVIKSRPPLVIRLPRDELEEARSGLDTMVDEYLSSLLPNRRTLLRRYRVVDAARKVVGVGSVGTRCLIVLLLADDDQPLFLQLKEATASVLEAHLGPSPHEQAGQRVVTGQEEIQAASDVFLGWARYVRPDGSRTDFYFRQLWDGKYSPQLRSLTPPQLDAYARLCGAALARAHARSGHPAVIAGYLGDGAIFTEAVVKYAIDYAALTETDHAELLRAVADGTIEATPGV
jgi:uncharacterized protein (DUF2252 family)